MTTHLRRTFTAACAATLTLTLAACGGGASGDADDLKIATQFGLSYLPDTVMSEKGNGYLQKELPDADITSVQLSSGGAVVEQLLSGAIDVGYMGIGPFLKAVDSGADLKAMSCLEEQPLDLMVTDPNMKSLDDLTSTDRIGLPGPSSHQAYTLQVAANKQYEDTGRFEKSFVGLPHPDAMAALLNEQDLDAHFTQAPFTGMEQSEGARSILNSYDVFGRHCLIVAVGSSQVADDKPNLVPAVQSALAKSATYINDEPQSAAGILVESGDETPRDQLVSDITSNDITWTTTISGLQTVADEMSDAGILNNSVEADDLVFDGTKVK